MRPFDGSTGLASGQDCAGLVAFVVSAGCDGKNCTTWMECRRGLVFSLNAHHWSFGRRPGTISAQKFRCRFHRDGDMAYKVGIGNVAAWRAWRAWVIVRFFGSARLPSATLYLSHRLLKEVRSKDWLIVAGGVLRRDIHAAIVYSSVVNAGSVILRSERKRCL